jgi:hypothetical protein
MNKAVQPLFKMHIRPIEPRDFGFIRSLASQFPTFTVPSDYLLWFFSHFHTDFCRVLEDVSGSLKAYLLAMPTSDPSNGVAIWQVAASVPNHGFALEYFADYIGSLAERVGATSVFFTAAMDPAQMRLIRAIVKQFFNSDVVQIDAVPAGQSEHEFHFSIWGTKEDRHDDYL